MKKLIASTAVGAAFCASSAFAGLYTGDTTAGYGTNPPLPTETGYYIWSNEDQTSWSVRWTGNNSGNTADRDDWYGRVSIAGADLNEVNEVLFESDKDSLDTTFSDTRRDAIEFEAFAGPHWDGFDFTITPELGVNQIDFRLGSDLFSGISEGEEDQVAQGIFVGEGNSPMVGVDIATSSESTTQFYQEFFITFEHTASVSEPATLAIFGLGLAGLGIARRKQRKQ